MSQGVLFTWASTTVLSNCASWEARAHPIDLGTRFSGHMPSCHSSFPCVETPPRKLLLRSQHFCLVEPLQRCDDKLVATVTLERRREARLRPGLCTSSPAIRRSPNVRSALVGKDRIAQYRLVLTRASKWRKCSVSTPLQCGMVSSSTEGSLLLISRSR